MVPPWVTASRFLAGNREAELKPTTFSLLLLFSFSVFPLLLPPQRYSTFDCCLLGYSLIIIIYYLLNNLLPPRKELVKEIFIVTRLHGDET